MLLVLGDFNAKLGKEDGVQPHVGYHILHDTSNHNGLLVAGLAATNNLMIKSTMVQHKNIHKQTWVSNDGVTSYQIDHMVAESRYASNIMDVRSRRRGADAS